MAITLICSVFLPTLPSATPNGLSIAHHSCVPGPLRLDMGIKDQGGSEILEISPTVVMGRLKGRKPQDSFVRPRPWKVQKFSPRIFLNVPWKAFWKNLNHVPSGKVSWLYTSFSPKEYEGTRCALQRKGQSISSSKKFPPVKSSPRWETCKSLHCRTRTQISSACVSFLPSPILPTEPFVGNCYPWLEGTNLRQPNCLYCTSHPIPKLCPGPVAPHFKTLSEFPTLYHIA